MPMDRSVIVQLGMCEFDYYTSPIGMIVDSINFCIANKGLKVYGLCLMSNHRSLNQTFCTIKLIEGFRLSIFHQLFSIITNQLVQSKGKSPFMAIRFEKSSNPTF